MSDPQVLLREHRAGEIGWVVHRHGALYAAEYGWNERFEGVVAEIAAQFLLRRDPSRERCWIAEREGRVAGSVFLMRGDGSHAKLRLLYVEPWARGHGIGAQLVDACVTGARERGYAGVMLWTMNNLHAARRLYEAAGFSLIAEESYGAFGPALHAQTWRLDFNA